MVMDSQVPNFHGSQLTKEWPVLHMVYRLDWLEGARAINLEKVGFLFESLAKDV